MKLSEVIDVRYIIYYLIIINCIGFLAMFIDKVKAEKNKWRIPEKVLFYITFLGGGIGTNLGMAICRHKTKKVRFVIGFPTIAICEYILIIYVLVKYFF